MPATSPLSATARSIGASVTLQLNAAAARMRTEGEPVIHLGGGEPKSLAPETALAAGQASRFPAFAGLVVHHHLRDLATA